MPDYLPRREGDRVAFAGRLAGVLVARPGDYGVSAEDAAAFEAQYEAAAQAWRVSQSPGTRTATAVQVKDTAVAALTVQMRSLVRRLRAYLSLAELAQVRGARLSAIGLRVPSASRRALSLPTLSPRVWLRPTFEGTIKVQVRDPARMSARAKPRGVRSLFVYQQVYSNQTGQWSALRFVYSSGQMDFELEYPSGAVAGDLLAVSVRWCSPSGQMGHASAPAQLPLGPRYGLRIHNLGQRAA